MMTRYTAAYLIALVIFVGMDMTWLGIMASRLYRPTLGDIAISSVNLAPAVVFYVLYPIGLVLFAIHPALRTSSAMAALIYGALFGFFTYATYDLTNQATLRNWSLSLSLVDIAWGTFLGAVTCSLTTIAIGKLVAAE
jgi:uncharacterized membrane protein